MFVIKRILWAFTAVALIHLSGFTNMPVVPSAHAEALASSLQFKVKKITENIEKSRESLAANRSVYASDEFKARQFQQRVDSYANALNKFPDVDDPVLIESKQSLANLQKEFQDIMNNKPEAPAAPNTASATTVTATTSGAELVSGQRVRVKKLAQDIANVTAEIVIEGPSELQSGEVIGRYNKRLQQFADALGRYEAYKQDPDIQNAAENYQALVAKLTAEQQRAQAQMAELGDVQARIAAIENALRSNPAPDALYPPFAEADARAWIALLTKAKQTAVERSSEMKAIAEIAYLPENRGLPENGAPYDIKDLQRLHRFAEDIATKVNTAIKTTQTTLKQRFDFQDKVELTALREMNPENTQHKSNLYLKEGAEGEVLAGIDKQMALAQSVAAYQLAFGKQPTDNTKARIAEIESIRAKYLSDRQALLGSSSLPAPASTDAERLAIARQILANKEYGFAEHGPVILTTADIVTREKEVSRDTTKHVDVSISGTVTLSGTRESWHYQWDEFKFATPIKADNGHWHVWWITAKNYASGWEKTPIGKWISASAVQGSQILPENF